jgi:hypothetical protein
VQNYHAIETELAHRRNEWERAIAAAELNSLARPKIRRKRWAQRTSLIFAYVCSRAAPRMPVTSWSAAAETHAQTPESVRATVV